MFSLTDNLDAEIVATASFKSFLSASPYDNGLDNIFVEASNGLLPRVLVVEAALVSDSDGVSPQIVRVTDVNGADVSEDLMQIRTEAGRLISALQTEAFYVFTPNN